MRHRNKIADGSALGAETPIDDGGVRQRTALLVLLQHMVMGDFVGKGRIDEVSC